MADAKLSELTAITGAALANTDLIYVDDVSAGTAGSKSITAAELLTGLGLIGPFVVQGSSSAIKTTIQTVESGIRKGGQITWTGKTADMIAQLGQYDWGWEFLFTPGSAAVADSSIVEFGVPLVFSIRSTLTGAGPYLMVRDNFDAMDLTLRMNRDTAYGEIKVGNFGAGEGVVTGFPALGLKFGVATAGGGATYETTYPFVIPGGGGVPYFTTGGTCLRLQSLTNATNPSLAFHNSIADIFTISSASSGGVSWLNSYDAIAFGTGSPTAATNERMRIDAAGLVGIGGTPNAAALLDVASTTKGFLPPRMTTTQRDNITSPPAGLVVYNSTTGKLNVRGAAAWEAVTSA